MAMVRLTPMNLRVIAAIGAAGAAIAVGLPLAFAAPSTDGAGYVDSTARCAAPSTVVLFGSTDSSRVAICKAADGKFEYRGVRISDGAKLIVPAQASGDGAFIAESGGIRYTVTAKSLVIGDGTKVIREEPMVDFHGPAAPPPPSSSPAPPASPTPTPSSTPSSTTPLPPPLPAEQGHGG
jgi:hypothetical protein